MTSKIYLFEISFQKMRKSIIFFLKYRCVHCQDGNMPTNELQSLGMLGFKLWDVDA